MLNRVEEELPSTSDLAKADDIELQEIKENAAKSMGNLILQLKESEDIPMCELLSLDKEAQEHSRNTQGGNGKEG